MNKEYVIYIYSRIFFIFKKEKNFVIQDNMKGIRDYYVKKVRYRKNYIILCIWGI